VIEQVGTPLELYHHPSNRFVAGFIGSPKMNFLPGTLVSAESGAARVAFRDGTEATVAVDATRAAKASEVTVGIRPEHMVHLKKAGDPAAVPAGQSRVRGEVVLVENLGDSALLYVRLPETDQLTLCRGEGTSLLKEGETVELGLSATDAHLFDADGKAFPRTVEAQPGIGERQAS
jgi:multiple sugar transport system ATP-binding protein